MSGCGTVAAHCSSEGNGSNAENKFHFDKVHFGSVIVNNKQLKVSYYKAQLECEWVLEFIQLECVFLSELGILNQPGKDLN